MSSFQWEDIDPGAGNLVVGKISNINSGALTATVEGVGDNIPIHYHCDSDSTDDGKTLSEAYPDDLDLEGAQAFVDGDDVLVVFRKLNNREPMIIGFPDYPHSCYTQWEPFGNNNDEVCKYHDWWYREYALEFYEKCVLSGTGYWYTTSYDTSLGNILNGKLEISHNFVKDRTVPSGPTHLQVQYSQFNWFSNHDSLIRNYSSFMGDEDPIEKEFMLYKYSGEISVIEGYDPPDILSPYSYDRCIALFTFLAANPHPAPSGVGWDPVSFELSGMLWLPGTRKKEETIGVADLRDLSNFSSYKEPPYEITALSLNLQFIVYNSTSDIFGRHEVSFNISIDYIDFVNLNDLEIIYPEVYDVISQKKGLYDLQKPISLKSNKYKNLQYEILQPSLTKNPFSIGEKSHEK